MHTPEAYLEGAKKAFRWLATQYTFLATHLFLSRYISSITSYPFINISAFARKIPDKETRHTCNRTVATPPPPLLRQAP